jgi:hypothetical protein
LKQATKATRQFASQPDRRARINRAFRREEETPREPSEEEDFTDMEDGSPDAELGGEG